MAVPAGPTEVRYVGNGVTSVFTIPFLLILPSDLEVWIDGVERTSGFVVTGAGNPSSTITFSSTPALGAEIYLALNVPFERLNDYQENGDFLAGTVNRDFDRIWQALKQLIRGYSRSLTLGIFDVDGQGWYRAKGNGIRDLADPVQPQDASNRRFVELEVNRAIGSASGPFNLAQNVAWAPYDGSPVKSVAAALDELKKKNASIVSALEFGVQGDGNAIQLAANYLNSIGGGILDIPDGDWYFRGLTYLDLYSNIHLRGTGKTVLNFTDRSGGYEAMYRFLVSARGTFDAGVPLTVDVAQGSFVIPGATATLSEGTLLIITSDHTDPGDTNPVQVGEYAIVDEILGSGSFRINNSTFGSYTVAENARFHVVHPVENITVSGIKFLGQGRLDPIAGDLGVGFIYGRNIRVRECSFNYIDMYQLEFRSCYDFRVDNCSFAHTKYTSSGQTPGTGRPVAVIPRGPVQYQIRVSDCCQYGVIENCVGENSRHMFNTGHSFRAEDGSPTQQFGYLFGLSRMIKVVNCYGKNTWHAVFSTHNDSEFIEFIGCVAENSGQAGFNPRHRKIRFVNCVARYCNIGFRLSELPTDISLEGCITENCTVDVNGLDIVQAIGGTILLDGCTFKNSEQGISFVPLPASRGRLIISNCKSLGCVPVASGGNRPIRVGGYWDSVVVTGCEVNFTQGTNCIYVEANTPFAAVQGCIVANGLRPIGIAAPVVRGVVANNVQYNMSVNSSFTNTSTTATLQNNI
ncbi:hypothetical protein [Pseudomonas sp. NMI1173_11]|uniref:hypothetical protein n=1 Tax=Pseudomonas sp. NMI1173_11 TaxID=2903145 RepID=UPI001E61C2CA|nr:hypothetical protein [Pseudomonas sp. NMI1173_11]MCE1001822.1 hypothetical protein [Pseudomonas sp. NMI1173_11]